MPTAFGPAFPAPAASGGGGGGGAAYPPLSPYGYPHNLRRTEAYAPYGYASNNVGYEQRGRRFGDPKIWQTSSMAMSEAVHGVQAAHK